MPSRGVQLPRDSEVESQQAPAPQGAHLDGGAERGRAIDEGDHCGAWRGLRCGTRRRGCRRGAARSARRSRTSVAGARVVCAGAGVCVGSTQSARVAVCVETAPDSAGHIGAERASEQRARVTPPRPIRRACHLGSLLGLDVCLPRVLSGTVCWDAILGREREILYSWNLFLAVKKRKRKSTWSTWSAVINLTSRAGELSTWSTWSAVINLTSRAGELRSAPSGPDDRDRATG